MILLSKDVFKVLSWGCGLQSTALAAMSVLGQLPKLDVVIHADTEWETKETQESRAFYIDWFRNHDLPVHIVGIGNIRERGAEEHIHVPFWTDDGGPLKRQCTREFKIRPIRRKIRQLLGFPPSTPPHPPPGAVELWLGITDDEKHRAKRSDVQYIKNRWPFLELFWHREALPAWYKKHDLPIPPKSACVCCPFRRASEWLHMRNTNKTDWENAVLFDEANRDNPLAERAGSTADYLYIWRNREPLAKLDLEWEAAQERTSPYFQGSLFTCEGGYCDV